MIQKPIYRYKDMVDYFQRKGITYNCTEKELEDYFSQTNFFYKLISYRKLFNKNNRGKYIDLSFEMLSDLSTIDMHLRYLLIKMCLDIEHRLKTLILAEITENENEDGYSIIDTFIATSENPSWIKKELLRSAKSSEYYKDLHGKYQERPPVWVIFETVSFGIFRQFVEFYLKRNKKSEYAHLENLLKSMHNVRNVAAHSGCLLNEITENNQVKEKGKTVLEYVINSGVGKTSARNKLSNIRIYDLTSLYILYINVIPKGPMRKYRKKEIINVLRRTKRNKSIYIKHNQVTSIYEFFYKIIR